MRTGSILLLTLLSLLFPAGTAQADRSHCPGDASGFVLWDVDTEPYQADNKVDAAGNDNGRVCARAMPGTFFDGQEYQLQNFIDDRV